MEKWIRKCRNARLNQAIKHVEALSLVLLDLKQGEENYGHARRLLDKACQCVHEFNAFDNALKEQQNEPSSD